MSSQFHVPQSKADADPRRWVALAVLLLASFMNLIDVTIVNVALPSLQQNLGADPTQIEWVIAAYVLAFALGLLPFGRLGDIVGRTRMFLIGVAAFTVASAFCGLAPSIEWLIVARVLQGLAGACMTPQVLAIAQVTFPPEEKGQAFSLFGLSSGLAAVAGPIVGGLLIGANLFDSESVTVGVGITPADGYRKKDAPPGIGKLSMGVGARGFVKFRQFGFEATLGTTKILAGSTKGVLVDASLSYPVMISEKLMLNPSIGTTYGDKKHNNRYFGVNAQQALASGLPQFRAGSGFIDAKADLGLHYRLTDRIGVGVVGGVTTLLGDVKDSPIVKRKTQPYGIAFVSYNF